MSERHKKIEIFNNTVVVSVQDKGLYFIPHVFNHEGKSNHKVWGNFSVSQLNPSQIHDIKFYFLGALQLADWLSYLVEKQSWYMEPQKFAYNSGKVIDGKFKKIIPRNAHAFFVLDNRFSTFAEKQVSVQIFEEWDEVPSSNDVVTTIPPQDKSLKAEVEDIIRESKTSLSIISPYIDMSLISDLLNKAQQRVLIQIVTRAKDEFKGKNKIESFNYLREHLARYHKTNNLVHSRIIIADGVKVLISSADLTQEGLDAQFNAGVVTTDRLVVRKVLEYFNTVWDKTS